MNSGQSKRKRHEKVRDCGAADVGTRPSQHSSVDTDSTTPQPALNQPQHAQANSHDLILATVHLLLGQSRPQLHGYGVLPVGQAALPSQAPIGNMSVEGSRVKGGTEGVADSCTLPATKPLRLPCRARGMPKDHNTETAFLFVDANTPHGSGLECCHEKCASQGVKFRWCSVCSLPVARRNFTTRHSHLEELRSAMTLADQRISRTGQANPPAEGLQHNDIPSRVTVRHRMAVPGSSALRDEGNLWVDRNFAVEADEQLSATSPDLSISSDSKSSSERKKEWLRLLRTRPSSEEGEAISAWLDDVMRVSQKATKHRRRGG